jgi:pimeloyl-ACP methyl ester carboxylesterase
VTAHDVWFLTHNKVRLALHQLRDGSGRPLLLLHGLGERSPSSVPPWLDRWSGPVAALDFTGHGESSLPRGGGYSAELLLADADAALGALGTVTVLGRGLGAYIALMLAGARPGEVHGAILHDGPGLLGGATTITAQSPIVLPPAVRTPDPYALRELSHDLRPPDYATHYVRNANEGATVDEPIAVTAVVRAPWLAAVVEEIGVVTTTLPDALRRFAS